MPELPERLLAFVNHGREERNLEYKEHLSWQPRHAQGRAVLTDDQAIVVKSVMAMSNIHLGGVLVIGVRDADGEPVGLTEELAQQFNQDSIAAVVNEYAAPYCELTLSSGYLPDDPDRWFVVIEVQEFATQPVILPERR